ncbi:hypothetical protein ACFW3D_38260 [Streptomyces sp. NPDC058864]
MVAEQHDVLIRRLGEWPALDVWNADPAVALRAAEEQLNCLLAGWLAPDGNVTRADGRLATALVAEEIRQLCRTVAALGCGMHRRQ